MIFLNVVTKRFFSLAGRLFFFHSWHKFFFFFCSIKIFLVAKKKILRQEKKIVTTSEKKIHGIISVGAYSRKSHFTDPFKAHSTFGPRIINGRSLQWIKSRGMRSRPSSSVPPLSKQIFSHKKRTQIRKVILFEVKFREKRKARLSASDRPT